MIKWQSFGNSNQFAYATDIKIYVRISTLPLAQKVDFLLNFNDSFKVRSWNSRSS